MRDIEPGRRDCPICGGSNTLNISSQGEKLLLHCHRCEAPFVELLKSLNIKPDRQGQTGLTDSVTPGKAFEKLLKQEQAAENAVKDWESSLLADPANPYLARKKVKPHGLRQTHDGKLILPARNIYGEIRTIQTISPKGEKRFLSGGEKKGSFFTLDDQEIGPDGIIYCAEGFATAATIKEATNKPTICAFDAGNLLPVAKALRSRYPSLEIVICGDDDRFKASNKGRQAATETALAVGGKVVFPTFQSDDGEPTDFNDLSCKEGLDVVKQQVAAACLPEEGPDKNKSLTELIPPLNIRETILNEPPMQEWVFENLIPAGTVGIISGEGGAGKSWLALLLAVLKSISSFVHQKPFKTSKPGCVIYLNNEDPQDEVKRRLHKLCEVYRFGITDIELMEKNLILLPAQGLCGPLMEVEGGNPVPSEFYHMLRNLVIESQPELIILDTKSRLFGLNENDQSDNAEWLRHLEQLCRETGCTIIILHHLSKQGRNSGGVNAVRGASTLTDNCRFVLSLAPIDHQRAEGFDVDPQKIVTLKNDKHNYGPGSKTLYFKRQEGGVLVYRDLAGENEEQRYTAFLTAFKDAFGNLEQEDCPTPAQLVRRSPEKGGNLENFQNAAKDIFAEPKLTTQVISGILRFIKKAQLFGNLNLVKVKHKNNKTSEVLCLSNLSAFSDLNTETEISTDKLYG